VKRVSQFLPKVVGFPRVLRFPPTGKVDSVGYRGGQNVFLSGNLGRRLEILCKIYNYKNNYCIICTLVIIGFRLVLAYARTSQ
jgi:hypothetical protein